LQRTGYETATHLVFRVILTNTTTQRQSFLNVERINLRIPVISLETLSINTCPTKVFLRSI